VSWRAVTATRRGCTLYSAEMRMDSEQERLGSELESLDSDQERLHTVHCTAQRYTIAGRPATATDHQELKRRQQQ
jgi:hypothetical protein